MRSRCPKAEVIIVFKVKGNRGTTVKIFISQVKHTTVPGSMTQVMFNYMSMFLMCNWMKWVHKCLLSSTQLSGDGGEEREPLCTSQSFPPTAVWPSVFRCRNAFVCESTTKPVSGSFSSHTGVAELYNSRWAGLWQIGSFLHIWKLPTIKHPPHPPTR